MQVTGKHTISGLAWLIGKVQKKLTIEIDVDHYSTDVVLKIGARTIAKGTLLTEQLRDVTHILTRSMKDVVRFTIAPKK